MILTIPTQERFDQALVSLAEGDVQKAAEHFAEAIVYGTPADKHQVVTFVIQYANGTL